MVKFCNFAVIIFLFRLIKAQQLKRFFTTQETAVGCSFGGDTCDISLKCAMGCFDCSDNIYDCNVCSIYYFQFTLPIDDLQLGLVKGNQVCLSCPFQSYNDTHAIYCGDCIENQATWENTRSCTYDYVIKYNNTLLGAYQQQFKIYNQLFFIVPIEYDGQLDGAQLYAPYQTQICVGCNYFCPTESFVCYPVSKKYAFDIEKYVSCATGFVYNIAIDGCDSCPNNCQSCTITVESQVEEDEIVYEVQKLCLNCNNGFSLFQGYSKRNSLDDPIQVDANITTRCEPCFSGCNSCYFGSDVVNLNTAPDLWNSYVKTMNQNDTWDLVVARLKNQSIEQRCTICQSSYILFQLPSLNMTQCQGCFDYCGQCEFMSYLPQYLYTPLKYPTQNLIPILNQTLALDYILRCRRCQNYMDVFNHLGQQCDQQIKINNCSIAYYDLLNTVDQPPPYNTTLDPDFIPSLKGTIRCGLCNVSFQSSHDKSNCTFVDTNFKQIAQNCLIFDTSLTSQICAQCVTGYTLDQNGLCQLGCGFIIKDFFCSSCYSYTYLDQQNLVVFKQKCLVCVFGYYPNILTGLCSPCSQDPQVIQCGQCQQYSFSQIYTNTIYARKPKYTDSQIQIIKNNDKIINQVICNTCAARDIILNGNSGYCESCQSNCKSCNFNAPTAVCQVCTTAIGSRSVSLAGDDCIQCPQDCVGCRERTAAEIKYYSPFFSPNNQKLQYFSRICYTCSPQSSTNLTTKIIYNTQIGRCVKCLSSDGCYQSITFQVYMYCLSGSNKKVMDNDPQASLYSDLTGYYQSKSQAFATIMFNSLENDDNYIAWNNLGADKVTLNLNFIQKKGDQINNECVMQQDTYITTGIMQNVFSVNTLNLNIQVLDESLKLIPGQSKISLYIFRNLYIEYFNFVSISGIQMSPSVDYNYKYPDTQIQNLKRNPFGIIMTLNTRASLTLTQVHILQTQAKEVYDDKSQYMGPSNSKQIQLKRFNPFFFNLLNIFQLNLTSVTFTSFSYLVDKEVKFNAMPFILTYNSPQTSTNFMFNNVKFEDFSIEQRYVFLLQPLTFLSDDPSIVQQIQINGFIIQDGSFINEAGLFGQHITKTESCGIISVNGLQEIRNHHNKYSILYNDSSNGLFNFWTAQKIVVQSSNFLQNLVNNTFQFYVNTIEMNDVEVSDSTYTTFGRFIHTQEKAPQLRPGKADLSGITFTINRARFTNITCLSQNCLLHAITPQNDYFLMMNITLSSIEIGNLNSNGFAANLVSSAQSAIMFISHIQEVTVFHFLSVNNKNLTILNINDVEFVDISKYSCLTTKQTTLQTDGHEYQQKDNMCLYVSNFYKKVVVDQVLLQNLTGIDNSFIVFSSWDIIVQNTTQLATREKLQISDLQVLFCTIITQEISSIASSVYIVSEQMQQVEISQSLFLHNTQIQTLLATLTPSNPTLLTQSIVGEIYLHNCTWHDNKVGGFGATLYIQMGKANLTNLVMSSSNWIRFNQSFVANNISYGGHLYLQGYLLNITNCTFQNASAVRGSGVYILSVSDGILIIQDTKFASLLTPLYPAAESRGGCMYVDSSNSKLQMTLQNVQMSDCAVRGDGGCIYLSPSSESHNIDIYESNFQNCFGLGGSFLKVSFDLRTNQTQIISIFDTQITQNYEDYVQFMYQVNQQNNPSGLNAIEQQVFIQRSAAIQQDSGYIDLKNVQVSSINFQGFLSLSQVRAIKIQNLKVIDSIIIYRPLIEILNCKILYQFQAYLNPTVLSGLQFVNITSYVPQSINCTAPNTIHNSQQQNQSNIFKCDLMQIKLAYPDQAMNPAIILVNSVTPKAPLKISDISISHTTCHECFGGLIQILGIYNQDPLKEMVSIVDFTCQDSISGYYGCLFASALSAAEPSPDDSFLNINFVSDYELNNLKKTISSIAHRTVGQNYKSLLTRQSTQDNSKEDSTANMVGAIHLAHKTFHPTNPFAASIRIQDVKLSGLLATYGGGIGIRGLTTNITNLASYRCSSNGSGGSIYFQADQKEQGKVLQRLNLLRNDFIGGRARIGGAIRTLESGVSHVKNSQVSFSNNKASLYGDDIATYPTQMQLVMNGTYQKKKRLNKNIEWIATPITINSGQTLSDYEQQLAVIVLLDENNRAVNYQLNTNSQLVTKPESHLTGSGSQQFSELVQGFDLSDVVINLDPYAYTTLNFYLTSSSIFIPSYVEFPPYYLKEYDTNYTLQGRFRSVECGKGQSYNPINGACSPCGPQNYVLLPRSVCKAMDQVKMNESYLNQISLVRGYWRSDVMVDNSNLCFNQLENCEGGWNVGNDMCSEGNIGALCESCDWYGVKWGEAHVQSQRLSCVKCAKSKSTLIVIGFLSLFTLGSIVSSIKSTKEAMELYYLTEVCKKLGWSSGLKTGANKAIMIKMITNYLQIIGVISQFQLTIPSNVVSAANIIGQPTTALSHSIECLLLKYNPGIDILYWRIIWSIIMNVIYMSTILLLIMLGHLTHLLEFKTQYIQTMLLYMFIYLHPNYVQDFIQLVSFRDISDQNWVQSNVSYKYDTQSHKNWMHGLGWPGLSLWAIVLPLSFAYVIYNGAQTKKLRNIFFRNSWGFFYNEYRLGCYYWEFVKIFQKQLIIIIMVFYTDDVIVKVSINIYFKGIIVFIVIYVYGRSTQFFRPFEQHTLNKLDIWSTNCCCLTIILAVLIYRAIQNKVTYISTTCYVFLGLINTFFFLCIFFSLIQEYGVIFEVFNYYKIKEKLDQIRDKIVEKKPALMDNPSLRPYLVNRTKMNLNAKKWWKDLAVLVNIAIDRYKKNLVSNEQFISQRKMLDEEKVLKRENDKNRLMLEKLSTNQQLEYDHDEFLTAQQSRVKDKTHTFNSEVYDVLVLLNDIMS